MATKPKIQKSWKTDLLDKSKKNPDWWIENVLGDTVWSKQKEICRAVVEHERVAVPAAFSVGKCFDDQTEILTEKRGWKLFKDLLPDDKVASLVDGKMVFVFPEEYYENYYEGEMIGCKSTQLDFVVTPHHRCYIKSEYRTRKNRKWEIRDARDIYGVGGLYFNKEVEWNSDQDNEYTEKHYELWGFWCADGCLYGGAKCSGLQIKQKNHIDYAKDLLSVYGLDVKEYRCGQKREDGVILAILNRKLAIWFAETFGQTKDIKRIPHWVKNAPRSKLRAFVRGFFKADGSCTADNYGKKGTGTPLVGVYYRQLAEDIAEIAIRAGYLVNIRHKYIHYSEGDFGGERDGECWVVTLLYKGKHTKIGPQHWYKIDYKGMIYCVKVSSGIILVRRNGLYHWSGNTWLAARIALWFLYNHSPCRVLTTAPTGRQVRDLLWAELRTAHRKSRVKLGGEPLTLKLNLSTSRFAVGFSTEENNIDMFTGYHASNQLIIFDQAGGLPKMFWDATEGLMTSANCRWLAISNTAIADGDFADICMPERTSKHGTWKIVPIKATESPNVVAGRNVFPGLIPYDWVEKRKEQWGEQDPMYRIFVEAEFVPTVEMTVIPYNLLVDSYARIGDADEDEIEVGLDVARSGLDSTVWFARCGERALELKRVNGNDTMQVAGETIEFIRKLERKYEKPVRVVKIDVIGVGAGVYDRLAEQDLPVLPINNAEVKIVADKERFSNVRAEMAWAFRDRFESGRVGLKNLKRFGEMFDSLQGDLQVIKYKITSAGKIQIQSKDEIKKKLGRSPDFWDAAVMAYEEPGGGPAMVEFMSTVDQKLIPDEDWLTMIGENVRIDDPSFVELERY